MNPESSTDRAADWAARLDAGPLSREDAAELTRWLDADPANEARLDEMQRLHAKVRQALPGMTSAEVRVAAPRRNRSRFAWAWGTLAAAATLVFAAVWFSQRPADYATLAAERRVVTLPDGTRAELNARTAITVRLRAAERIVRLERGEAFFAVAKDPARPFRVETAAGAVRVTGTVFNLRAYEADAVEVVLLEGAVDFTPLAEPVRRLAPGDALKVTGGRSALHRLDAAALANAVAWRDGNVVFQDAPLEEAAKRFAEHHARPIEVAPAARGLALGGRFALADLDAFLRDLEVALPVKVQRAADGGIRIEAAPRAER